MRITGRMLLDQAQVGIPSKGQPLTPEALTQFCDRGRTAIFLNLKVVPVPLWLLQAINAWYVACGPLKPTQINRHFLSLLASAWPKCPVKVSPGRPKDDDDDDGGGPGGLPKPEPSAPPEPRAPITSASAAPPGVAALQKEMADGKEQIQPRSERTETGNLPTLDGGESNHRKSAKTQSDVSATDGDFRPEDWPAVFSEYKQSLFPNYSQPRAEKFCSTVLAQPFAIDKNGKSLTRSAIIKRCQRATGINLRKRPRCTAVVRREIAIHEILVGPLAQHRRDAQDKGAGLHSLGSRRAVLEGVLRVPAIQQALKDHPDIREIPSRNLIESVMRAELGAVNRAIECKDHLERCLGFRTEYSGQVAVVDATGWPVCFRYGDKREKHKRWIFLNVDVASARVWMAEFSATSESEGWRPKDNPDRQDVMLLFLRMMGFFPEWLINDAISTLTDGLRFLKPGQNPSESLSWGMLLWLAGGVRPYVRMGERPTGGAQVERAVRSVKDRLAELGTKRAVMLEAKGAGLQKITGCDNELEFMAQITQAVSELNASKLQRRGCPLTREQLFLNENAQGRRAARSIAANLWHPGENNIPNWRRIIGAAKVGTVNRGRINVRLNGKPWVAELERPGDLECRPEERTALILPPGARQGDDPESFRIIIIETEGARVQYHPATAKAIKVDEYWQDISKPLIGDFRALPEGAADKFARNRDAAAAEYRSKVAAKTVRLKEGTTGKYI